MPPIADYFNSRVRMVATRTGTSFGQSMTAGNIYTVAGDGIWSFSGDGGPGTGAQISQPWGVAVNGSGDLMITDSGNNRVRMVSR